jgi:hypothetical protein
MAAATVPSPSASEVLRQAIVADGRPVLELARAAGVEPSVLGRFMRQDGLPLGTFDTLARGLGLELRPARPPATLPELAAAIAAAGRQRH